MSLKTSPLRTTIAKIFSRVHTQRSSNSVKRRFITIEDMEAVRNEVLSYNFKYPEKNMGPVRRMLKLIIPQ